MKILAKVDNIRMPFLGLWIIIGCPFDVQCEMESFYALSRPTLTGRQEEKTGLDFFLFQAAAVGCQEILIAATQLFEDL